MTGRTELHICQGNVTGLYYRDNVTEPIAVPYFCRHGNAIIFQDDNARAHRGRIFQDHLQFRRINTLPRSAKSPDLSPVEHLWDILGRRVRRHPHKLQDIDKLAETLLQKWRRISHSTMGRLARSKTSLSHLAGGGWRPYSLLSHLPGGGWRPYSLLSHLPGGGWRPYSLLQLV